MTKLIFGAMLLIASSCKHTSESNLASIGARGVPDFKAGCIKQSESDEAYNLRSGDCTRVLGVIGVGTTVTVNTNNALNIQCDVNIDGKLQSKTFAQIKTIIDEKETIAYVLKDAIELGALCQP